MKLNKDRATDIKDLSSYQTRKLFRSFACWGPDTSIETKILPITFEAFSISLHHKPSVNGECGASL